MSFDHRSAQEPEESKNRSAGNSQDSMQDQMLDPMMQDTLRDFRLSVHAWSEAAYIRPRPAFGMMPKRTASCNGGSKPPSSAS